MSQVVCKRVEHSLIAGVPVAIVSEAELVSHMVDDCARRRANELAEPVTVMDCNGQAISMHATDPVFAKALNNADLVHADGQFIVWLSKLNRGPSIPERTATTDLIHSAAKAAAENGLRFYLLGGSEEINRQSAEKLLELYPDLIICGRHSGYFADEEEVKILADINNCDTDVLWVGLGKPKEQAFAIKNQSRLDCAWIVTCGGCFHFIVGDYARAPVWMQSAGLEWLHRMATGPRYLIKRYLITIPHALWLVFYRDFIQTRWLRRK